MADSTALPAAVIVAKNVPIVTVTLTGITAGTFPMLVVSGSKFAPAPTTQKLSTYIDNAAAAPAFTSAYAVGKWIAAQTTYGTAPFAVTHRDATLQGVADITVGPGPGAPAAWAIGEAQDPWIFTPDQPTDLTTEVDLSDVSLQVNLGSPSETGTAGILVTTAFGTGSVPGQNVLAQDTYSAIITNGIFTISSMTLLGQTFHLQPGVTYWQTADVTTSAEINPPSSSGGSGSTGTAPTTTAISTSANPSTYGQPVTFTAVAAGGGGTPTGTVSFYDGSTFLGTAALDGTGTARFRTSALPVGGHTITAVYGGDSNFAGSTSGTLTETITAASTTTSVWASMSPSDVGQPLTFTAAVSTPVGFPTGTVSFYEGTTLLGTGTLDLTGTAQFTTSALPLGNHTITAVYGGDGNFVGSSSAPLTEMIKPLPTVTVGSSVDIAPGSSFSRNGSFTGSGTSYTATIDYGDGSGRQALTLNANGSFTLSHSYAASGNFTVTVRVTDDSFGVGTATLLVNALTNLPTATFASGAAVPHGTPVNVSFTNQSDPSPGATFTYSYDFLNDGSFSDPGDAANVTASSWSYIFNVAGTYTVHGRMTDQYGAFIDFWTTVTIL